MAQAGMGALAGKKAVITGAAKGIGAAIAERFVAEGAEVLLADIDGPAVAELAARLGQHAVQTDVSRMADLGIYPRPGPVKAANDFLQSERALWKKVVQDFNVPSQ